MSRRHDGGDRRILPAATASAPSAPTPIVQPPVPGEWASNWGAIAVDSASGIVGTAAGFARSVTAEEAALDDCRARGGSTCLFGYSYKDGCVAMVQGDKTYFFESALTASDAERRGLDRCNAGQTGCRVRLSACTAATFIPY